MMTLLSKRLEQNNILLNHSETANFKSYDDLKEKLNRVISGSKNTETASDIDLPPASVAATMATTSVKSNEASSVDEDDDTLSYFSKLAEDE